MKKHISYLSLDFFPSYFITSYFLPGPGEMRKTSHQNPGLMFLVKHKNTEGEARELNGLVRNSLPFESICYLNKYIYV